MKDILELIKLLVAGQLDVNVNLTVTGTVTVLDPSGNHLVFALPDPDPVV